MIANVLPIFSEYFNGNKRIDGWNGHEMALISRFSASFSLQKGNLIASLVHQM
jgi:hypothetical protein